MCLTSGARQGTSMRPKFIAPVEPISGATREAFRTRPRRRPRPRIQARGVME